MFNIVIEGSFLILFIRCQRMFCYLVRQSSEKIDRTRSTAGEVFYKLLHHKYAFVLLSFCFDLFKNTTGNNINNDDDNDNNGNVLRQTLFGQYDL